MGALNSEDPPRLIAPEQPKRQVWKFLGTALWGLFAFAGLAVGQLAIVAYVVLRQREAVDIAEAIRAAAGSGTTISLSVIMGLPALLAALWLAIRFTTTPFADYLALRWTSWKNLLIGIAGLLAVLAAWDLMSRALGRELAPDFMVEVLKSARADRALWLLIIAFCVAAPVSEEVFARGFLYRGWSQSLVGPVGAILLSSLVWTGLHVQYNWYFFGEVFTLGLWFGYVRYRSGSTVLTILLHGLNNFGAVLQTIWLAGHW
ncbi:MAG: CPBP family intramembrane metalloprotease [Bradyrhizobium sp.]|nr:CPBP family intramembrane metalloprotease [Bradyrhizobium sp.]